MNLIFSDRAWEDYQHWQDTDRRMLRRINELLKDIKRSPCGTNWQAFGHAVWTASIVWFMR